MAKLLRLWSHTDPGESLFFEAVDGRPPLHPLCTPSAPPLHAISAPLPPHPIPLHPHFTSSHITYTTHTTTPPPLRPLPHPLLTPLCTPVSPTGPSSPMRYRFASSTSSLRCGRST